MHLWKQQKRSFALDFRGDAPQHAQPGQDEPSNAGVCPEQSEPGVRSAGAEQSNSKNSAAVGRSALCLCTHSWFPFACLTGTLKCS